MYENQNFTATKKEYIYNHQNFNKMNTAKKLAKLLNEVQEITNDYLKTLSLVEMNPEQILEIENEDLKRTAALIYLCTDMLRYAKHEIIYNPNGFNVQIINNIESF